MRDQAEVTMTAQTSEGFLVAKVKRDQIGGNRAPYFSVGGDLYTSRRAFDLGSEEAIVACGCLHDDVLAAFPQLAPAVALHLAWTDNGEPLHGAANGWYFLSGGAAASELRSRERGYRNDYRAPEDADSPDWGAYWRAAGMRALRCTTTDLADARVMDAIQEGDREAFEAWVDEVLRPRWQREADDLNAWIDANRGGPDVPADTCEDEEDYYLDFGEPEDPDSLRIHARLDSEESGSVGVHYTYAVSVMDGTFTYETTYGGSVADHQEGRVCAREAAFGVLSELASFAHYGSPENYAHEMGMEREEIDNWEGWEAAHAAAVEFSDHLEAHGSLVGQ